MPMAQLKPSPPLQKATWLFLADSQADQKAGLNAAHKLLNLIFNHQDP